MNQTLLFRICITIANFLFIFALEDAPLLPGLDLHDKIRFKGRPVSPCAACQKLVTSFLAAVDETARDSFAGGDADWERKKLGNYENSEVRLIDIQEKLCDDVKLGKDQCYNLAEIHESELEEWFYEKRHQNIDLFISLCIENIKVCCPNNTYGPNCIPCPGGIENPCGGNGKCLKGGTREEPASCFCNAGYKGELCRECEKGYYQEPDPSKLSCKICDRSCKGHCRGPGPKNCEVCAFGYRFVENEGCVGHFDDYQNKYKIEDESNKSDIEPTDEYSADLNQKEDITVDSNIKDPSVDVPHTEL